MKNTSQRIVNQLLSRGLAVLVLLGSLLAGTQAWAQSIPGSPPPAPLPGTAPAAASWVWIMMALFLFALVMLISLRPGKRSHQD